MINIFRLLKKLFETQPNYSSTEDTAYTKGWEEDYSSYISDLDDSQQSSGDTSHFDDIVRREEDVFTDPSYCYLEGNIYHDLCHDHHDHSWDDDHWDDHTWDAWDTWDYGSTDTWNDDW